MLRGFYIAGTGMLVERARMNIISNNITNTETVGYKKDCLVSRSFADMLLERMNDPSVISYSTQTGPLNTGTHIDEEMVCFGLGSPEQTDLNTDMCLTTQGFFVVKTTDGDRYTRAGNFHLTADGTLVNSDGYPVQSETGDIKLTSDNFKIKSDGTILNLDTGATVGKLKLVDFEDRTGLRKQGNNLFYEVNNTAPITPKTPVEVLQGYIESSNAGMTEEMTSLMTCMRQYESNQRILKMVDSTMGQAVNDIARF